MSDYTAIRGVTLSLKTLLDDRINASPDGFGLSATITISRPDVTQSVQGNRLNLYLYEVLENHCLANQEDPRVGTTRDYGKPPLSLNLRYLLTAYATADTDETEAHRVLGAAMRVLHENAILLPSLLQTPVAPPPPPPPPILDTSLLDALEHIRISLLPLTSDELSKIWTGAKESMRLSVAYEVTVVQIESTQPRVFPLPVRERNVVTTVVYPRIHSIELDALGIGDTLNIFGEGFFSATTKVYIDDVVIDLSGMGAPTLSANQIQTTINDPLLLLWPGTHALRVKVGFDAANAVSNAPYANLLTTDPVPLTILPKITPPLVLPSGPPGIPLTLNGNRLYRAADDKNIFALIAGQTIPANQFTTKLEHQIQFNVPLGLSAGNYPVHLRFNAFESHDDIIFQVT